MKKVFTIGVFFVSLMISGVLSLVAKGPRSDIKIDSSKEIMIPCQVKGHFSENQENNVNFAQLQWWFNKNYDGKSYKITIVDSSDGAENIVGTIDFSASGVPGCYFLSRLWVHKKFRGHCLGELLFKEMISSLKELNALRVDWTAMPFDLKSNQKPEKFLPKLIHFYEKMGGQVVSMCSPGQADMTLALV